MGEFSMVAVPAAAAAPVAVAAPAVAPVAVAEPAAAVRSASLSRDARRAFGALIEHVDDPWATDLIVHVREGRGTVWIDRGSGFAPIVGLVFDPDAIRQCAIALIAAGGRQLDALHPCGDVVVGDGIRVHAVLPPVSPNGPALSIRLPPTRRVTLEQLIRSGWCTQPEAVVLREAVAARQNILLTGGTGSGKTTVLAALLDAAPAYERVLTIEDVAELRLTRSNWVALEARRANAEGVGAIHLDELLREALRMRPDRLVLGECRGAELATLLTALNTGHDGGAGTLHASRLSDVPMRLEALGLLAGLSPPALARQAIAALHLVVHLRRWPDGRRSVDGMGRLALVGEQLVVAPLGER